MTNECKDYIGILTPFENITDIEDTPVAEFEGKKYWVLNFWNTDDFESILEVVRSCSVCKLAIISCEQSVKILRIVGDTEWLTIADLWNK